MKENFKITAAAALIIAAVPFAAVYGRGAAHYGGTDTTDDTHYTYRDDLRDEDGTPQDKAVYSVPCGSGLSVYITSEDRTVTVTERDYVIGAVFAEMPADYPIEALKAQAAAARTYALRRKLYGSDLPGGADISDDGFRFQAYFTPEKAKAVYGDKYEEYLAKISEAADSVDGIAVFYGGEPIVAAFHPLSAGKTESSENVWGEKTDYLVPAESPYDSGSPDYISEEIFSEAELFARFSQKYPGLDFSEDDIVPGIEKVTDSGTVMLAAVSGNEFTGADIESLLTLPSAVFDVSEEGGNVKFTVRGTGHGVGMSQYGAKRMAEEGFTYDEILLHYYSGAEIVNIEYDG